MRAFFARTLLACLGLGAGACQEGSEHQDDPVLERDTGTSSSSKPDLPEPDCVGLPEGIGTESSVPRRKLPGPARAIVSARDKAWVCGQSESGGGFVVALGLKDAKRLRILEQRSLDFPCQGLVLGNSGLALLLEQGRVLWLPKGQAKLSSFGATTQSSALDLPPGLPWRGVWSAERESLYLAAGKYGVLRLYLEDAVLVQDFAFVGPELQDARDLALLGSDLIVADSRSGLLAWDLERSELVAQWRDPDYFNRPGAQRVLAGPENRLQLAAGHTGYYRLDYRPERSEFVLVDHQRFAEPTLDLGESSLGGLALTASRLYRENELLYQSFPELSGQSGFEALAAGSGESLWLARAGFVEYWEKAPLSKGARLVPLLGYGSALHGVSGNATSELTFEVRGEGELWVARPEAPSGSGLLLETLAWPTWAPSCAEHARFEAGERFSLRVRARNPEKLAKTVSFALRSSDSVHGKMEIAVDLDTPRPRDRVGRTLDRRTLVDFNGYLRPVRGDGAWNWLEFVSSQQLSSPDCVEGLYQLAELVQAERRNGKANLIASVVVGGRYPQLDSLFWVQLERLRDLGLEFYFDERFAMHRNFAHLPNGRLYPLRVLVDPESKIRYLDQHLGGATAMAKFREFKFAR